MKSKIKKLTEEKEALKARGSAPNDISKIESRIKMLTDIVDGKIDMNKAEELKKGVEEINQKIKELEERKLTLHKELEKYPLTNSILMNLLQ